MKAMLWPKYGPPNVLRMGEIEKPIPAEDEILVRVHASTVTMGDCELRAFRLPLLWWFPIRLYVGLFKPRRPVLGQELSGVVESLGKEVTRFQVGDEVIVATGPDVGAYAEYRCQKAHKAIALKPEKLTFEEAATIPTGGLNAIYFLRRAKIQTGEKVLIIGAGGSIGTYGIQIAKAMGAEVTGVDSTGKLDMLKSIGADHVIDYTEEEVTHLGRTYDVIFDVAGKTSFSGCVKCLNPGGRYLMANPELIKSLRGLWVSRTTSKTVMTGLARENPEAFEAVFKYVESGHIKPVIDKRYPLSQLVEAHEYVDQGLKAGNVIVTMDEYLPLQA